MGDFSMDWTYASLMGCVDLSFMRIGVGFRSFLGLCGVAPRSLLLFGRPAAFLHHCSVVLSGVFLMPFSLVWPSAILLCVSDDPGQCFVLVCSTFPSFFMFPSGSLEGFHLFLARSASLLWFPCSLMMSDVPLVLYCLRLVSGLWIGRLCFTVSLIFPLLPLLPRLLSLALVGTLPLLAATVPP